MLSRSLIAAIASLACTLLACADKKAPAPAAAPTASAEKPRAPMERPPAPRELPDSPRAADRSRDRTDDTARDPDRDRAAPWTRRDPDAPRPTAEERQARRDARRAEVLDTFDADQDGQLSDAERAAMHETRTVDMIARLDTDQNGTLSAAEFAELAGRRRRMPDFATVDANHDGAVSSEELMALPPPRRDRDPDRDPTRDRDR